jgi:hypothetical protein
MEFFYFFEKSHVFNLFHDLKNVKIAEKRLKIGPFGQFYPHFMNFNHVLKKVGRRSSDDLF